MGLLGRARSMMQGWSAAPPSRPQSYSVACAEGHRLQGQRTEGYQALRCPTCGEGIFVLPAQSATRPAHAGRSRPIENAPRGRSLSEDDALVLADPPAASTSQELADIEVSEAEIDWVDEIPPQVEANPQVKPQPSAPNPRPKTAKPATEPVKPRPPVPTPTTASVEPTILVETPLTLKEWAFAHRNALLVATVLILVVGAVGMRLRRQRFEELPQIAETGRIEGLKKLDAGEFFAAKKILGEAADAVNGLGGQYEGADAIRQGALEAAIFADLAPAGIDEILDEAAHGDPARWPARFASMYKGRSVILDPPISDVPDPVKPGASYKVNYPLYFGRGPKPEGRGRINFAGFKLFELSQPKIGEQKPFGARYASVEFDDAANLWVVTFEPDSGVYITHPKALDAISWPTSESTEEDKP